MLISVYDANYLRAKEANNSAGNTHSTNAYAGVDNLRPTMPARISARLTRRPVLAGSPNNTMPSMAVPIAPTPTQTA